MLDPLVGLALAGPVLQAICLHRVIASLTTTIRSSGDLTKAGNLRSSILDAKSSVTKIWKFTSDGVAVDEFVDEQQVGFRDGLGKCTPCSIMLTCDRH